MSDRSNYPASIVDDAKKKAQQLQNEIPTDMNSATKQIKNEAQSALATIKGTQSQDAIQLYSPKYYAICGMAGLIACGTTHTAITPLDFVKTRRQVAPTVYRSNIEGWKKIYSAQGVRGIFTGWSPTFFGYCMQGGFKYGGYEIFKQVYSTAVGDENAKKYKTSLYLAASATAEFFADIALCPFEAIKVRMQGTTQGPPPYRGTVDGLRAIISSEGVGGLYKGIFPLWGRQIPYTMTKFASFETIVEMIYARLPRPKEEYGPMEQTAVSFTGGYLAGILCATVSHPADVMVSRLNSNKTTGESFGTTLSRIYRDIGFKGLWNGLPMRIVMIGTLTGLQWMLYDDIKILMGLPTTGGH